VAKKEKKAALRGIKPKKIKILAQRLGKRIMEYLGL
jgi:hypothetical protein